MGDTATKTRPVHFRSKCHNLRMVRVQETEIPDPLGGKGKQVPGLRYEFVDSKLVVDDALMERDRQFFRDRAAIYGREEPVEGKDFQSTLDWFRSHEELDKHFFEIALSEMAPPPKDALKRVARHAANADKDALQAFLAEEEATYQREDVIDAAREALDAIEELSQPPENPPEG